MADSTKFPTPSVSFRMTLEGRQYYLSLQDGEIVARVRNLFSAHLNIPHYWPYICS